MSSADTSMIYGLSAQFNDPESLMEAANKARKAGYKKMDAYTPFPVEGLDEALGMAPTRLGWVVLVMAVTGGLLGFFMQYYSQAIFYPINIGSKPFNSWPNFVVITFESTIIFAAFTAGLFMLGRNGFPRPYHSIFNTPNFERASRDKFFLCIEAADPKFDLGHTRSFLESLKAEQVAEVEI